jgi:hypothetical protein
MKVKDINYYVKFIFSSLDGQFCLSTTDLEVLKNIKSDKTNNTMRDYTIGDIIYFDSEEEKDQKLKVTDVRIRRLVDNTDTLKIGFDSSDCENIFGDYKEPLFILHITIEKV